MTLLLALAALSSTGIAAERQPIAWALEVEGRIVRNDGSYLDPGEAIEPGATLALPVGAVATVAHNGRIERWEGPGSVRVGDEIVRFELAGQVVRRPHVEAEITSLSGETVAPGGATQVTSALGIPLDARAWARQDAIDGGSLHALYRDALKGRLAAAGVDPKRVADLGLTDALPGNRGEQVALVGSYLDLAGATPGAAVLLEVPPTKGPDAATGGSAGALTRGLFAKKPRTFRVDAELDKVRTYGIALAEVLRARGHTVFALVVPYANTVDNIVARRGRPADGVENLHHLLVRAGGLDTDTRTIAFGYSQGAAVVRDYVARYGDSDGLDYAIPIATMGGADGAGADGVWTGRAGIVRAAGVSVLSVVHGADPARGVHGRSVAAMLPGMMSFAQGGRPRGDDLGLHMSYHGSNATPLPSGAKADAGLRAGIHGYPTAYLAPLFDDLLAGRHEGAWARRGDWTFDTRIELTAATRGDFTTLRRDPRVVADGYLPASAVVPAVVPVAEPSATPAP